MSEAVEINFLVHSRGGERYIWIYRDDQMPELQKSLGRFACNRDLSFTWSDAACVVQLAKQMQNDNQSWRR
jgi:hypothetical protein